MPPNQRLELPGPSTAWPPRCMFQPWIRGGLTRAPQLKRRSLGRSPLFGGPRGDGSLGRLTLP